MKNAGLAVLVLVAAIAGWMLRGVQDDGSRSSSAKTPSKGPKHSLPPETVLAVHPGGAQFPQPVRTKLSAIRQEANAGGNLGAIYARLVATNPRTPEEQWLMARLLSMCGRVRESEPPPRAAPKNPDPTPEQARAKFIDSLSMDDPDRDKRIAAYDSLRRDHCETMKAFMMPPKEWRALLEDAAASGNVNARLDIAKDDIAGQFRAQQKSGNFGPANITPLQVEVIKQAIASGDPYAITEGVNLLSISYANLSLRDSQGQAIDKQAIMMAARLMSCDAGYPCDATGTEIVSGCALFDRCGATNYRDYTMYYGSSPYVSQRIAQYEQALHSAAANGDWSGFRFHPGPSTF